MYRKVADESLDLIKFCSAQFLLRVAARPVVGVKMVVFDRVFWRVMFPSRRRGCYPQREIFGRVGSEIYVILINQGYTTSRDGLDEYPGNDSKTSETVLQLETGLQLGVVSSWKKVASGSNRDNKYCCQI